MTLQISTRKLLIQEIRQNGWMFGLTALMHFLTGPVVFLLYTANYENWTERNADIRFIGFFSDTYLLWQIVVIIASICIAIFIYKYLFSRKMVDLYHSVPINRGQLFLVKYLHGLLIWLVPFLCNVFSVLLLYVIRTFGNSYFFAGLGSLGKSVLLLIFCFFIFYHLFLTAVYLSGNVLNMFTNTAIIGCSVLGLVTLYFSYASTYFETYCSSASKLLMDIVYSVSPFAAPFAITGYYASGELGEHIPLLVLSIPVSIGLLGVAWILCLKRPSELAERGTVSKKYTIPARIIVSIIAGISGALFFSEISSNHATLAWGIFGAVLCSIFCFGAVTSIFGTTIKYFFRQKKQMFFAAVVSTVIVLLFQLDIFSYDTYLPDKEDIAGIAIYTSSLTDESTHLTLRNDTLVYDRTTYVSQQEFMTDTDICYDLLNHFLTPGEEGSYTSVYTKIKLKNGYTYERRYRLPSSQYTMLAPFVETDEYKDTNYKFSTGTWGYPASLNVELWNASFNLDESKIKELMDAYYADFEDHYTLDELSSYMERFSISGEYGPGTGNRWFYLDIPDNYTRTISLLQKWYPEYTVSVDSVDDIKELNLDLYHYTDYEEYDYSLDTLYEYFGYEVMDSNTDIDTNTQQSGDNIETETVAVAENGKPTIASVEYYGTYYYKINDKETLEELFPLMSFGYYRDSFDREEYIYLGEAVINNYSVNCYVKPESLPKEFIQEVYNATTGTTP